MIQVFLSIFLCFLLQFFVLFTLSFYFIFFTLADEGNYTVLMNPMLIQTVNTDRKYVVDLCTSYQTSHGTSGGHQWKRHHYLDSVLANKSCRSFSRSKTLYNYLKLFSEPRWPEHLMIYWHATLQH